MDKKIERAAGVGPTLCLSRNGELLVGLERRLAEYGASLESVDSIQQLRDVLARPDGTAPGLVLVDLSALPDLASIHEVAETVAAVASGPISIACLGGVEGLDARLAALRAGIENFIPAGIAMDDLARRIGAMAGLGEAAAPRILVVDDQPVAALFAARVLEGVGMVTERVGDPLRVLDAMTGFGPDLVLMDLHMPGASGIELTRIIRGQEPFADLPILFLSGELDQGQQLDALRVGDDFLAKPVSPEQLVGAVRQGLERARRRVARRSGQRMRDGETGLVCREDLLVRLDHLISTGAGSHSGLIYLDCPPQVSALRAVAAAVRSGIGPADLAARAGEHGIAVLTRGSVVEIVRLAGKLMQVAKAALGRGELSGAGSRGVAVGWCPVAAGGDDSLTLVSRARGAARSSSCDDGSPGIYQDAGDAEPTRAATDPILTAIAAGAFQLLYQPMAALRGAVGERYEAIPRLRVGEGDLLPPARFVPVAQGAGEMASVDRWILEAGLDVLVVCRDAGHSPELFLHQSAAALGQKGWASRLRDGISRRDLIHLRPVIQLQIAELIEQLELAARRIEQLHHLGIGCCLNGLTEDPKQLEVLGTLPPAYVRLAGSAVRGLPPSHIRALVSRVHARGGLAIVGGVDSPQTIARIVSAKADLIQGPYVQPPVETMSFEPELETL